MCENCGCSNNDKPGIKRFPVDSDPHSHSDHTHSHSDHTHTHTHSGSSHSHSDHSHSHTDSPLSGLRIDIGVDILGKNNRQAAKNREFFKSRNLRVINIMGSPGSGKTTLLEATIKSGLSGRTLYVIEGDQYSDIDADRIHRSGTEVIQINTATRCHLDADTIMESVKGFGEISDAIIVIENIGNLVCPALFDLGEESRVIVLSVAEGDDKPLKYLTAFREADIVVFSKSDLLPYVNFDVQKAKLDSLKSNPNMCFFTLSATSGEGISEWIKWLAT